MSALTGAAAGDGRRLLIANHIDGSLLRQVDQHIYVQRIFWLARPGDIVVLPAPPDAVFLRHVCALVGMRAEQLTIVVVPEGRHGGGKLLDPLSLRSAALIDRLLPLAPACSEVFCLWPGVQTAQLAARLGLRHALPGAPFFQQGGDALVNSKATFRALAAACGTPIPRGTVCRSVEELGIAARTLLDDTAGVMVKQAHNGAAAGCTR